MKIVIATGIYPPDIGGPASYVPRIASALTARGHAVEVVTLADDPDAGGESDHNPFRVHRIRRSQPRLIRMLQTIRLLSRRVRAADVLLANGIYPEAAIASKLARRPAVAKVVGDTVWERARHAGMPENLDAFQVASLPIRWRILRMAQNLWIGAFDRVLTPSAYLRRIAEGWGVRDGRIAVVYNAVPKLAPAPALTPEFDLVSVGRLVPWKGFEALIRLAARRRWSLAIVGDGPLAEPLRSLARSEGAEITFMGHLSQEKVPTAIRSGRVFVLNSSYEGLPHIVLEAMAAGVPVVASAAGGTPETIDHGRTGLLVRVDDDAALEAAIEELLAEPARRAAMAEAAALEIDTRFGFDQMVSDTETLLAKVAAGSRQ